MTAERASLRIPVYYDFASTLCYVAHRVLGDLAPQLDRRGIALDWRPIDLTHMTGWRRGAELTGEARARVARIGQALIGPIRIPRCWLDSRAAAGVALTLGDEAKRTAWRERVWTAIYEEGLDPGSAETQARLARDVGIDARGPDDAAGTVEAATTDAQARGVTAVPTFLLGEWPMSGIQDPATMLAVFHRFARRSGYLGDAD